ncbi:MAG TPA: hypothetical protein VGA18_06240, partial [Rhodothermales bacterium]
MDSFHKRRTGASEMRFDEPGAKTRNQRTPLPSFALGASAPALRPGALPRPKLLFRLFRRGFAKMEWVSQ